MPTHTPVNPLSLAHTLSPSLPLPEQVEKAANFGKQRASRVESSAGGIAAADAALASLSVKLQGLRARLDQAKTGKAKDWDTAIIANIKKEIERAEAEKKSAVEAK